MRFIRKSLARKNVHKNSRSLNKLSENLNSIGIGGQFTFKGKYTETKVVERIEFISEEDLRKNRVNESDYDYYDSSKGGFW